MVIRRGNLTVSSPFCCTRRGERCTRRGERCTRRGGPRTAWYARTATGSPWKVRRRRSAAAFPPLTMAPPLPGPGVIPPARGPPP